MTSVTSRLILRRILTHHHKEISTSHSEGHRWWVHLELHHNIELLRWPSAHVGVGFGIEAITKMRMVPIGSRLIYHEIVQERVLGCNGTLSDTRNAIHEVGGSLEHAVPMLIDDQKWYKCVRKTPRTILVPRFCAESVNSLMTFILIRSPWIIYFLSTLMEAKYLVDCTFVAVITGPGWAPLTRDALHRPVVSQWYFLGPGDIRSFESIWTNILVRNMESTHRTNCRKSRSG